MAWSQEQTLAARWEQAVEVAEATHGHWTLGTSYAAFAEALVRETPRLTTALRGRFRREMRARAGDHWERHGRLAVAVDGTRIEAPHTAANEAGLRCAGREKTGPQVSLTMLWHAGTGLPWDYRLGPGTESEQVHLAAMVADLPAGTLLLADAGFASYELCRRLLREGHSFLFRVGGNRTLLTELGYYHEERAGLVYLWPLAHRDSPPLVLRLIELPAAGQAVFLLTDVLDPQDLSDEDAATFYAMRWGEEVFFRSYKQTLARRKVLSRTPGTCFAEVHATVLGLWLLGLMSVTRLTAAGHDPLAWSAAKARTAVRRGLRGDAPRRRRRRRSLNHDLSLAVRDDGPRRGPKRARNYPRKKRQQPPGPPKLKAATAKEVERAARFPPPDIPKRRTA